MSDNTYNIPTMSTGTMVEQLTELYTQAYRNHTLSFLPSVALWGPMGVGKSTAVKTIAENLSKEFHQHVGVTDIHLTDRSSWNSIRRYQQRIYRLVETQNFRPAERYSSYPFSG